MHRNTFIDKGYTLAKEMSPGEEPLSIHMRQIFEEFTRRLADRIEFDKTPVNCYGCDGTGKDLYTDMFSQFSCGVCGGSGKLHCDIR